MTSNLRIAEDVQVLVASTKKHHVPSWSLMVYMQGEDAARALNRSCAGYVFRCCCGIVLVVVVLWNVRVENVNWAGEGKPDHARSDAVVMHERMGAWAHGRMSASMVAAMGYDPCHAKPAAELGDV